MLASIIAFLLAEVLPIVQEVITYLTPLIVLGVTWFVVKVKPLIPGWATLLVVSGLTTLLTFLLNLVENPNMKWYIQLLYGLLAVVIQQFIKQFSPEKINKDKTK